MAIFGITIRACVIASYIQKLAGFIILLLHGFNYHQLWQSRVEIKGYSVTYFGCIAAFEVLYCLAFVKGGAHMCFVDLLDYHTSTKYV